MIEKLKSLWARVEARLVDDWREAKKWWSVRLSAIGAVLYPLLISVQAMPPEIQAMFPVPYRALVGGLFSLAVLVARVYSQRKANG
jgi:hypothetical protein